MVIIFDLDGTLFQTKLCVAGAVHQLFSELGLPQVNDEQIISLIGQKTEEFLSHLLPESIPVSMVQQRFRELEQIQIKEHGILFPGIEGLLQHLKEDGHTLYVCSNGSKEYCNLVLKHTNILRLIDEIVSAKDYPSKADAVRSIVADRPDAVIVGDTASDFEAAANNQIPSIGVLYGYGSDLSKATFTVKDTSGKSIFTEQYSKFLTACGYKNTVLHIDDFHNPSVIRYQGDNEIDAYYANAFNYKQLIDEVLRPLKEQGCLEKKVLCLNLNTDRYENWIHYKIDTDTILLIEGVLLFRPPLISFIDGTVFLSISFDEVLKRAKVRDVPKYGEAFIEKYKAKYIPIQKRYIKEELPVQRCDIVIDNEDYTHPRIERGT